MAVLAADVAGYSRLMAMHEARTLADLRTLRATLFEPVVTTHGGQVVKRMGDGWLVVFASAMQDALVGHDRIRPRMGVNVGDVVH